MAKKAAAQQLSSSKSKSSKGKQRSIKKLNKKRGLPTEEPAEQAECVANEEGEELESNDGPDIVLMPDASPEESLVLEVLKKEAALEAASSGERSFPKKKRPTRPKAERVDEAEYLVRTDKSKFRIVDLSANATSSHLRPASNFREHILSTRSNPRRMSSKQLIERQQKLKWMSARN